MSGQIRLVLLKHRLSNPDDLRVRSVSWHEKIVEAMRERDTDKSVKELGTHMAASSEWVQTLLKQRGDQASGH